MEEFIKKCMEISVKTKVPLPSKYFWFAFCKCWKCHREILVFDWPGTEEEEEEYGKPLHSIAQPQCLSELPRTVKLTWSNTTGFKYWANNCPYCYAIQGDWFLHHEPEGAFFGKHNLREEIEEYFNGKSEVKL